MCFVTLENKAKWVRKLVHCNVHWARDLGVLSMLLTSADRLQSDTSVISCFGARHLDLHANIFLNWPQRYNGYAGLPPTHPPNARTHTHTHTRTHTHVPTGTPSRRGYANALGQRLGKVCVCCI